MRLGFFIPALLLALAPTSAFAWGPEGHSIVAEIAQRRLTTAAEAAVQDILKSSYPAGTAPTGDVSLASIASWADDDRDDEPATYDWHFVDIPITTTSPVDQGTIKYYAPRQATNQHLRDSDHGR